MFSKEMLLLSRYGNCSRERLVIVEGREIDATGAPLAKVTDEMPEPLATSVLKLKCLERSSDLIFLMP